MTRFARRVCSIGCVALVLSAFALTIMVIPSGAFGLTFTTIDAGVRGARDDRGRVLGYQPHESRVSVGQG